MVTQYKNRTINYDKPVKVYRNLNRKGTVFSIQQGGLVVAHGVDFGLIAATMKVSEAGRQRVLNERRKNVHAFITGLYMSNCRNTTDMHKLNYNPYVSRGFLGKEDLEVNKAEVVCFTTSGVFYYNR